MGRMNAKASTITTFVILILTVLLPIVLCEDGNEALIDTVVVRNKLGSYGRNNVVVKCKGTAYSGPWESTKELPNGEEVRIPVSYDSNGWGPTTCNVLLDRGYTQIYSSDKDHERCKVACFFEAWAYGLFRWNEQKKIWEHFGNL